MRPMAAIHSSRQTMLITVDHRNGFCCRFVHDGWMGKRPVTKWLQVDFSLGEIVAKACEAEVQSMWSGPTTELIPNGFGERRIVRKRGLRINSASLFSILRGVDLLQEELWASQTETSGNCRLGLAILGPDLNKLVGRGIKSYRKR